MIDIKQNGYIFSFDVINDFVNGINDCQKKSGSVFEIPKINIPGLGNVLFNKLLLIDAGLVTSFKPIAELKKIFDDYIKPSITKPPELIEALKKLAEYVVSIKDLLENPIEFILNEIFKPLENLLLPFSIDLSFFIPGMKIDLSKGFKKLPKSEQERLKGLSTPLWIKNMSELILIPVKMIVGLFKKLVEMIIDAVNPTKAVIELPKLFIKCITDFKDTVIEIISQILETAINPLLNIMSPGINIQNLIIGLKTFISDIFTGEPLNFDKYNNISSGEFNKIKIFITVISCFLKQTLTMITKFPTMFF
jgi:hypothetical protein